MTYIKISLIVQLVIVSFYSSAQDFDEKAYNRDLSLNYGIYPALISDANQSNLAGTMVSAQGAYFFYNNTGIRTGLTFITDMEGTDAFITIPIMFAYRTKTNRDFYLGSNIDSFGDLIFQLILGLIPKQAEYHVGMNIGYIDPDNNIGLSGYNDGTYFEEGYKVNQRFTSSVDAGLRLTYRIYRFGIVLSPSVSYMFTNNFEYYSELDNNSSFNPNWFMNLTLGLSYRF
ncbi:MAG: hypothetical protein A2X13_07205 [Bacteroidetes bacterium GWC2_33_15]|nr:MAG: hypothetical protein A2X10_11500 [Bacteroidetes bacterium GWA2_33_15]OFX51262.1 MAG: hypothetical protein A2X13_07205 [Bacteroidetes bacterium GWC2_33_15]OFX66372.1 MAG: hypothetical protein A2X15_00260 [Bacteroidetes bacterium GWB2_32_14]OFX70665.1 MAG: hypothetical protein A2X14_10945 [Bacteroidetes bacterium GWD2_33_33]HAN20049.1 hypothetical protein [Bacteroidales bacterium]